MADSTARNTDGRLRRVFAFLKGHGMLCITAALTLATMMLVPPDGEYLSYVDWRTLGCLFSVLAMANAFRSMGLFDRAAHRAIERLSTQRAVAAALIATTGALSMIATNDMALIVMLPLTATTLVKAGWQDLIAKTFVLEGLAANLCGMILPFGNPQNLYLYSYYSLGLGEFAGTMAVPFVASAALLALCTWLLFRKHRGKPVAMAPASRIPLEAGRLGAYPILLLLTLLAVLRIIPAFISVIAIIAVLAYEDPRALRAVDYPLLLTFLCFFVFAGNMARLPLLSQWLTSALAGHELVLSAGLSQIISNVPAAVLLSHFTEGWQGLLVGVNIGGAGTLVGSLANLITLHQFSALKGAYPALQGEEALSAGRFMRLFTGLNFLFLAGLLGVGALTL